MIQCLGEIVARESHKGVQELRIRAPELARELKPGQPVLLRGAWGADLQLRRTFYPIWIEPESWVLRLPPSGDRALAWLSAAPVGAQVDCLGPVGSGFQRPPERNRVLCLGQGGDSWKLLPAVTMCAAEGARTTLLMIGVSKRDLVPPARIPPLVEVHLAVEESASNFHQRMLRYLREMILWADLLFAAGDLPFYSELQRVLREVRFQPVRGFAQLLLSAQFMCGYGACGACAVDLAAGQRLACANGPVFDLLEVVP